MLCVAPFEFISVSMFYFFSVTFYPILLFIRNFFYVSNHSVLVMLILFFSSFCNSLQPALKLTNQIDRMNEKHGQCIDDDNTTQQNKLKWKYHYIPVNRRRATAFLVKLPSYKSLAYGLFSLANAFFSGAFFLSFFFLICVVWWWW